MRAVLLGTSGAWPVPRPGCECAQCAEARSDVRFARTRSGLLIEAGAETVLVDAGPDLFQQFERQKLAPRIDRVLITHTHVDHVGGLDDLVHMLAPREGPLPVHADATHADRIRAMFPWLLEKGHVTLQPFAKGTRFAYPSGIALEGFETGHRDRFDTTGLVIELDLGRTTRRIVYATDMGDRAIEPPERLRDVDLWVGDGTYLGAPDYGHPGTDRVLEIARSFGAKRTAFTHVGHWQLGFDEARAALGPDVHLCRDGEDLFALVS